MNPIDKMTGRQEGGRRRDEALGVLEARRETIVNRGRRALLLRLLDCETATADDVREAVDVPAGVDPVCLGACPSLLARLGLIERIGFTPTTRAAGHARPVSLWALTDREGAERWLANNHEPSPIDVGAPGSQATLWDVDSPFNENAPRVEPRGQGDD